MKTTKLVSKIEKELIAEYIETVNFNNPPSGFSMLANKVTPSQRFIQWRLQDVFDHHFLFQATATGTKYLAIACFLENDKEERELFSIDALYPLRTR